MRRTCLTVFLTGIVACSSGASDSDTTGMVDVRADTAAVPKVPASLDHVILAVNDLQAGIDQFERLTGIRAQFGGAHPGAGTQNALVSLGGASYLEILAPNPEDTAGATAVAELAPYITLLPAGWAMRSEDLDALADSLGERGVRTAPIRTGARLRSTGARLEWRTLGVEEPAHPLVPFFIQWGAFSAHPATTSPMGCTLRELRFENPAPDELRNDFDQLGIEALIVQGPRASMHLRLDCPTGRVDIPAQEQ
jgi:hypothetical protein